MSKNRVIVQAVLASRSHGALARQYGISTAWVGTLVARSRTGGCDAIEKQSTGPKTNPKASPEDTVAPIVALRPELTEQGLDAGPHTIAAHLQGSGQTTPPLGRPPGPPKGSPQCGRRPRKAART